MQPTPTHKTKNCKHPGTTPIIIGGHPVWLGASRDFDLGVLSTLDYVIPLNGDFPWLLAKDNGLTLPKTMVYVLADHGGVPENWAAIIADLAAKIKAGVKIAAWCTGSHGRTGCFGASLIAVMEPETADPIAAIRERHCSHCVESQAQAKAVFALRNAELPDEYVNSFNKSWLLPSTPSGGWTEADWTNWTSGGKSSHPTPSLSAHNHAAHGQSCFCEPCLKRDGGATKCEAGDKRGDYQTCRCRRCTVLWKLNRRDLLDKDGATSIHHISKHDDTCLCGKCWESKKGHGNGKGCVCPECLLLNLPDNWFGMVQAQQRQPQPPAKAKKPSKLYMLLHGEKGD